MQKELRSGINNFWLLVYGPSQFVHVVIPAERFLARGGSWWLVVARGGSWWLVVARGGSWWLVVARGGGGSWWFMVVRVLF